MNVPFREILSTYKDPGEDVVNKLGDWTAEQFARMDGADLVTPVLIAAYDEEDDLPTCLASIARQTKPVRPIVIDNGSGDRTAEFAEAMGAEVIEEPIHTKIQALSKGLIHVATQNSQGSILLTDADTVVGSRWANLMAIDAVPTETPAAVQIGAAYYHNIGEERGNTAVDIARSLRSFHQALNFPKQIRGRGHNMALWFNNASTLKHLIDSIDPELKCLSRDDTHIAEQVIALGGVARTCIDPRAAVFTRGDRMPDIRTFVRCIISREYRKVTNYQDWYDRVDK